MTNFKQRLARLEKFAPVEDTRALHQLSRQELRSRIDRLMERVREREGFSELSPMDEEYAQVIEGLRVFFPDIAAVVSKPNSPNSP